MSKSIKLDKIDITIINLIVQDARTPFKDIAVACGLSRAAVHQRVQRLSAAGVILGSGSTIDYRKLGYKTCTYVGISLEKASQYQEVSKQLAKIPEVVECDYTTGPYSLMLKLYAKDNEHLMHILNGQIQQIDGVCSTETLISLEQSFARPLLLNEDSISS